MGNWTRSFDKTSERFNHKTNQPSLNKNLRSDDESEPKQDMLHLNIIH